LVEKNSNKSITKSFSIDETDKSEDIEDKLKKIELEGGETTQRSQNYPEIFMDEQQSNWVYSLEHVGKFTKYY